MTKSDDHHDSTLRQADGTRGEDIAAGVSNERWRSAQEWELAFWNRQNISPAWWKRFLRPLLVLVGMRPPRREAELDDRNHWWMRQFSGYRDIPQAMENVCELGCGPYTNLRLLREGRNIVHAHCSDPLARNYINYEKAWLACAHRRGLVSVDYHPAEECPYRTDYFDCVIMINVLDHVMDARACLEQALRITKPGGYLVFGQDLVDESSRLPQNPGHPFVMNHAQLNPILEESCDSVYLKLVPHDEVPEPEMHCGALAFIGRKRPSDRRVDRVVGRGTKE